MSTAYVVYRDVIQEVTIVESSSRFDLDLMDTSKDRSHALFDGPQQMSADETLDMAVGIFYAVWCMYPEKAEGRIAQMNIAGIPAARNHIEFLRTRA